MATSIFEKNGQQIEVPTEALGKAMSDVSGGYQTGQTEQQRLESQGYKLLSPYSGEKVVDNTNQIRTDLNTIDTNINDVTPAGYDFNQTSYLSQSQKDELARLDAMAKGIGTLNDEDRAAIEAAGAAAGMKYDPLISEAKEEKRKGMPKAVISAGERGGFMSTQMSGEAALGQTEGGDWIGAGGELENIKSVYDTNIQNLQVAKERAIIEAKAAAEEARRTGKRQDMQAARDAFEFAQNASLKAIQLSNEKVAAISNWNKLQSDKKQANLSQISDLAMLGMGITPDIKQQIDSLYGEGYTQKYYEVSQAAKNAQSVEDSIKLEKDLYDLLSKVPTGTKIKIGDATYEGLGSNGNFQIFSESDTRGTTYVTFDKNTGKRVSIDFLAGVGATKPDSNSSSANKEDYFTAVVDGKTKYFYGKNKDVLTSQEIAPEEYRKGVSSAANTMPEGTASIEEKRTFLKNALNNYGYDDIEKVREEYFKKFGAGDTDYRNLADELNNSIPGFKDKFLAGVDNFYDFITFGE